MTQLLRGLAPPVAALLLAATAAGWLPGRAQAQVSLAWPTPAETPGAKMFAEGRYEAAAQALQARLSDPALSGARRLPWSLELSRALHGSGDHAAAQHLAEDVAAAAERDGEPEIAAKAMVCAADIGFGRSFAERLAWLDRAAKVLQALSSPPVEMKARLQMARAQVLTRQSPPAALEIIRSARSAEDADLTLGQPERTWMALIESRAQALAGAPREALPLALAAFARLQEGFGPGHPVLIYAGMQQALVHRLSGNYSATAVGVERLLEQALRDLPDAHPWTVELWSMQVQELRRSNDLSKARQSLEQLVNAAWRRYGEGSLLHLSALTSRVELLLQEGSYADALTQITPIANAIAKLALGGPAHMDALHVQAMAFSHNGQTAQALRVWQELLLIELPIKGEGSADVWATMNNIASQYRAQRDLPRALAEYTRLEALMRSRVQRTNSGLVSVTSNAAETLVTMRRPAEARDKLLPLIADLEIDRPPLDPQLLRARSNLASAHAALGQRDLALSQHQRTLDARRQALGDENPDTLTSMAQVAYSLDLAERNAEALEVYIDVYRRRLRRLGPLHGDTILSARAAAGFLANPMRRLPESAQLYGEAVRGVEVLRQGVGLPDEVRQRYFGDVAQMYKNYARVLGQLGRWQEAFDIVELSKARTLVDRTRLSAINGSARMEAQHRTQLTELELRVVRLTTSLALRVTPPGSVNTDSLEQDRDRALDALRLLRAELGRRYGWASSTDEAASAARARTDLEDGDAFVSISMIGDALLALHLRADGQVRGQVLPPVSGLRESITALGQIASVRGGLDQVQIGVGHLPPRLLWKLPAGGFRLQAVDVPAPEGATPAASVDELVAQISQVLLEAIPAEAWASRRLLISPDEQLATAPLDLLMRDGRRWAESHEVTIAQSWTMHTLLKQREREYAAMQRDEILVFGNPAYVGGVAKVATRAAFDRRAPADAASPIGILTWYRLPGAEVEVRALSQTYSLVAGQTLFEGASATEAKLVELSNSGKLERFRIVHFATHGYLHPRNSLLSSVVLAEAGANMSGVPASDGYVTAAEWQGLRLRSDLTVLAACDSGSGEPLSGEGMLGLPFGLFAAGNRSTLLTLWSVYDEATAEFIRRFHQHLRGGKRISTALALTKREFMLGEAGALWREPAFWAPFVLYGT